MTYSPVLIVHILRWDHRCSLGIDRVGCSQGCPSASSGWRRICHIDAEYGRSRCVFSVDAVATAECYRRHVYVLPGCNRLIDRHAQGERDRPSRVWLAAGRIGDRSHRLDLCLGSGEWGRTRVEMPPWLIVVGSVAWLAASGDIRMLIRGGASGAQRLVRHLWRMCVALFIATTSFFIGTASDPVLRRTGLRARLFPEAIRKTHLPEVPVLIIVILTIFWLCPVWFTNAYRKPRIS